MDTATKRCVTKVQKEFKKAAWTTALHRDILRKFSQFERPEAIRNYLVGPPHFKKCTIKRIRELRNEAMELLEAERRAAGRSLFMRILDKNHMMQEALIDRVMNGDLRAIDTMTRLLDQEMKILQFDRNTSPETDEPIEDYTAMLLVKIQKINDTRTPVTIDVPVQHVADDARTLPAETVLPPLPPFSPRDHY